MIHCEHCKMIPRYLRSCVKLLLELTVIVMFVFATSSTTQCRPKTVETLRQGYVTIKNIGIKLCQLKCIENGACLNFEYNIETLTCRLSKDEPKKIKKQEGYISLPRSHSDVPTGVCASKTCSPGLRCLETRSGKAVCVQDGRQNYLERSPQHNSGKQDTLENNPLYNACRKGDLGRVRRILSRGMVDVNSRDKKLGRTPLMMAAQKGHRRIFDLLIRKGANILLADHNGNKILHLACIGGHVDMVKYVLSQCGVDINSKEKCGKTPLMKAVYHGHRDVFEFLASKGANMSQVDKGGNSMLHLASIGGHVGIVKQILSQYSVDINSRTKSGKTPLMKAVYHGHRDAFEFLVSKGANMSLEDKFGDNILHVASNKGDVKMVKHILSHGIVNINSRGTFGRTALMSAAYYGHRKVFDLLASRDARTSLVDDYGDNILHVATYGRDVEMVKHILSQNISDINARNKNGETPAMIAKRTRQFTVYVLLVSRGCPVQ